MRKLLTNLSFKQQVLSVFSLGIVVLSITSSLIISSISSQTMRNEFIAHGKGITAAFAKKSTLALLYQSTASAKDAANAALSFPDVIGLSIYDANNKLLYSKGNITVSDLTLLTGDNKPPYGPTELENSWLFSSPVYAGNTFQAEEESPFSEETYGEELVGHIALSLSKNTLNSVTQDIFTTNLLVSLGLSTLLLIILLSISNRLTRPLASLAEIMGRAENGETDIRAEFEGPQDIQNMETAFNTMMGKLESREKELIRARDSALVTAKTKGEFAANVSHELRTPMNGIMGMLQLLETVDLNTQQKEYVNIALDSSQSLLNLIDDILDFSKIESGKLKLRPSEFNPRDLIRDITELLRIQANNKHIQLKTDIDNFIPKTLIGDTGRIRQVLINLVGNAIKFTDEGSITIQLSNSNNSKNNCFQFSVIDTGMGIPEDSQKLIFQAFAQVDGSSTRRHGGTGLGLAICQQLVELMGGNISVTSIKEEGSTFTFNLPLEIIEDTTSKDKDAKESLAGLNILLVSSNTENCQHHINYFIDAEALVRRVDQSAKATHLIQKAIDNNTPYNVLVIYDDLPGLDIDMFIEMVNAIKDAPKIIYVGQKTDQENASYLSKKQTSVSILSDLSDISSLHEVLKQDLDQSKRLITNLNELEHASTGNILVVEDNRANQHVASAMLDRLGLTSRIVSNGEEAIEAITSYFYEIILMDCNMPGMDGYEATRRIRNSFDEDRQPTIIALTAETGSDAQAKCLEAGMDDYLPKPLTLAQLNEIIRKWLPSSAVSSDFSATEIDASITNKGDIKDLNSTDSLDAEVFNELANNIPSTLPKMVRSFMEDTPEYLIQLDNAIKEKNTDKIKSVSHYIRGSASNLGATRLANICSRIETEAFNFSQPALPRLFSELEVEQKSLNLALNRKLTLLELVPPSETNPPTTLGLQTILIVDDEKSARFSLHGVLERDGYNIIQAENGLEAIKICKASMPDLILMDAMMPEIDGFTACQRILQMDSPIHPHVLIVTALNKEESIEKAFTAGAADFIPKPVNLMVLRKRVERLLLTRAAEKSAHKLAYYDELTNLPNRTSFIERAQDILHTAKQNKALFAILFLDLDRFKLVNDSQGHDAGDLLLKTVAKRIHGCVRSADLVARLGGDEFTIILDKISSTDIASKIAEKLCRSLSQSFSFMDKQVFVSTSIGIAVYPNNGEDITTLMKHADTAMFRAKSKGGNCFQYYEYGMETEITRKIELESELRQALKNDELLLHYQPQEDLNTGEIVGLEALVRWQHPQRGLLPPGEFIPIAEESNLILLIGEWVLRKACQQVSSWNDSELSDIPVSVNVASTQLESGELYDIVKSAINRAEIPSHLLKLELTENTLVNTSDSLIEQMHELKKLGVALEIDDFGTGFSSLSYLKRFPVDALKIDRSFISDLPADKDDIAIVSGIIALGHSLGLEIIAEGVETAEQKDLLCHKKCDAMQGYYLSRPLAAPELEHWLSNSKVLK